eukprot:jgi/Botrbrau1/16617/Bobra.0068s0043.1
MECDKDQVSLSKVVCISGHISKGASKLAEDPRKDPVLRLSVVCSLCSVLGSCNCTECAKCIISTVYGVRNVHASDGNVFISSRSDVASLDVGLIITLWPGADGDTSGDIVRLGNVHGD